MAARAMLKMSTEATTSEDNGADSTDIDVQKDNIDGNLFHCCNYKCYKCLCTPDLITRDHNRTVWS